MNTKNALAKRKADVIKGKRLQKLTRESMYTLYYVLTIFIYTAKVGFCN